jgi:anti-sigma B factor antagonist
VPEDPNAKSLLDLSVSGGPDTVIHLRGDLDPATAPALDAALADAAADPEVNSIAIDLSGLSFLDSSGLRVFVVAREAMRARGAAFTLRAPTANVRRLLDVTGLGEVIEIQ